MPIHECTNCLELQKIKTNYPKIIIKLGAPWCQPCINGAPIFEKYSNLKKDYKFVNINIDLFDLSELGAQLETSITSVPILVRIVKNEKNIILKGLDEDKIKRLTHP